MLSAQQICERFVSAVVPVEPDAKVGVALATLQLRPLNALRHPPGHDTSGWYIWGGPLSEAPDFFQPLHIHHLPARCPEILPYLSLAPGWRVLLAPGREDVWFDEALNNV